MVGAAGADMKSPSMHGMKGAMSPVIRGPGGPGMSAGRNDPVGAREEVSDGEGGGGGAGTGVTGRLN